VALVSHTEYSGESPEILLRAFHESVQQHADLLIGITLQLKMKLKVKDCIIN
jgi:hypothetical protein